MTKKLEVFEVRACISSDVLFDCIAEQLQDNDDLDLDFDSIHEQLSENFNGFTDVVVNVEVDMEKKEILGIYTNE